MVVVAFLLARVGLSRRLGFFFTVAAASASRFHLVVFQRISARGESEFRCWRKGKEETE